MDSAAGIRLRFAHQHALISDDLYEEVVRECPVPLGRRDCSHETFEQPIDEPWTGYLPGQTGVSADDCYGPSTRGSSNGTCHWYCPIGDNDPNYLCCNAQKKYDKILQSKIKNILLMKNDCIYMPAIDRSLSCSDCQVRRSYG